MCMLHDTVRALHRFTLRVDCVAGIFTPDVSGDAKLLHEKMFESQSSRKAHAAIVVVVVVVAVVVVAQWLRLDSRISRPACTMYECVAGSVCVRVASRDESLVDFEHVQAKIHPFFLIFHPIYCPCTCRALPPSSISCVVPYFSAS